MRGALRLYGRYVALSARAQLQYRASFALQTLGQLGITCIEFFSIWALFHRFHRLGPWTLPEVGLFYGVVGMAWALADTVGRGFDNFGQMVKAGDFDRILLRPRATVFQLLAQDTQLRRIGRMAQAVAVLAWSWTTLGLGWAPGPALLTGLAVLGGAALFFGLLVVQATISFWTVESLEIMNVMTYGGVATAQYPMSIYPGWLRKFFLFVVPLGAVTYLPVAMALGKSSSLGLPEWSGWAGPLAGFAFLLLALRGWRFGVRHYTSTGS
jgi:ABC-2 type transport system permease protein